MKFLLYGLLILVAPKPAWADPCIDMIPPELRPLLRQHFPDHRLPLSTDALAENQSYATQHGDKCLLVAKADFDADGRTDMVLLLPSKDQLGYRLVVALNSSKGYEFHSLLTWKGPFRNMFVDATAPGMYRHTTAFAFTAEPGALDHFNAKHPGFLFGEVESAADAYFLDRGRWIHVHTND